jgi:hypothetical protein
MLDTEYSWKGNSQVAPKDVLAERFGGDEMTCPGLETDEGAM